MKYQTDKSDKYILKRLEVLQSLIIIELVVHNSNKIWSLSCVQEDHICIQCFLNKILIQKRRKNHLSKWSSLVNLQSAPKREGKPTSVVGLCYQWILTPNGNHQEQDHYSTQVISLQFLTIHFPEPSVNHD